MLEAIEIGGVRYVPVEDGTLEHDLHYMQLYAKAGLSELKQSAGESPQDFSMRVLGQLLAAGVVLEMFGTLLVPDTMDSSEWTPETAKQTALVLSAMRDPEAKKTLLGCVAAIVLDFFRRGLVSFSKSSQSSIGEPSPQTSGPEHGGTPAIPMASGVT
jgi:hypothetical protein